MTKNLLLPTLLLSCTFAAYAAPTLIVGTPANALASTGVSPRFGTLINFDELTPNTTLSPTQYVSKGVTSLSSPDGLTVLPYSTQSGPNEIFDNSQNGTADITLRLSGGVQEIGVGIADSDPVTIMFQSLNSAGTPFGTAFSLNIANNAPMNNPGNAYYILSDTSQDIFGFVITQPIGSSNYSGLAIDDVQFSPEPASFALLALGAGLLIVLTRWRKKAA